MIGFAECSSRIQVTRHNNNDTNVSRKQEIICWSRFRQFTTIFTTTRLFFSKHFWALCNTLPSIIPYMGSAWCYRNWIELEGITMALNYPVNLRWRVIYWLVRGFRVVDVARTLHVWQIFVKKFRHLFRIKYPLGGLSYAADGKLAFNLVNKLNRSVK